MADQTATMRNEMLTYKNTDNLVADVCGIIDDAQRIAYQSVNITLVIRNWLLGRRISEEELDGEDRAEYGAKIIKSLSTELSKKYGTGFSARSLYKYQQFFKCFPEIVPSVTAQSGDGTITVLDTLR